MSDIRPLNYVINIGDTTDVPTILNNSVDFAVTSPPYGRVKAYSRADERNIGNYALDDYFKLVEKVYREVYRSLKPGRNFVVNIMDIPGIDSDGRMTYLQYGQWTKELLEKIGFLFQERVIWNKGRNRTASTPPGTFPYPASPVLLANFEWNFIMRKPGKAKIDISEEEHESSKLDRKTIAETLYTVWQMRPETSLKYHKAPFPTELPERFMRLYSFVGETVYDPFLGSGTVMLAAKQWGRSCIGTEIGYTIDPENMPEGCHNWLDAVKKRVGWGNADIYGRPIQYTINDLGTGRKIEDLNLESKRLRELDYHQPRAEKSLDRYVPSVDAELSALIEKLDSKFPDREPITLDINTNEILLPLTAEQKFNRTGQLKFDDFEIKNTDDDDKK